MRKTISTIFVTFVAAVFLIGSPGLVTVSASAADKGTMHVAFDGIPEADMLNFLIAVHRAKERGVKLKISYLQSEDIAAQAVVSGQADIGVGTS